MPRFETADGFQRSLNELRQKHNIASDPLIGTMPIDLASTTPTLDAVGVPAPAVSGEYEMRFDGNDPTKSTNLVDRLRFKASADHSSDSDAAGG